jgi:WD repeat-containing protein 45
MALPLSDRQTSELLYVGFNQDNGCFACGTDTGFRIYNCDPFKEMFRRHFTRGGIGIVEMLFRCNILALVGGGQQPRYPPNKVMLWDDHQNRPIGELTFRSAVKAVKLRRDRVVVVLEKKIYVYNFADLKLVDHIETTWNPRGLCALCPNASNTVLACPGLKPGHVKVDLYDIGKNIVIPAHESDLACIALNHDGSRLATASDKGTLVRVFDTQTRQLMQELRRGVTRAEVLCIAFHPFAPFLACSSDQGTIHVFSLDAKASGVEDAKTIAGQSSPTLKRQSSAAETLGAQDRSASSDSNQKSTLSFMKGVLPKYFSSEWSFAQFRIPETRTICAFGSEPNTLLVIGADGSFHKVQYAKGQECERKFFSYFVKPPGAEDAQ